jgi:hypothetical protein
MMCFSLSMWYTYECTKNSHGDILHLFYSDQVCISPLMLSGTVTGFRSVDVGFDNPHFQASDQFIRVTRIKIQIPTSLNVRHHHSPALISPWNTYQVSTITTS